MAIQIVRGTAATKMRRGDVPQGLAFAVADGNGRLGVHYAAIGANGRLYSVNLKSGVLASSGNRDKNTTITGKWKFKVTPSRYHREVTRSEVRPGEVFKVAGGNKEYAHMGRITKDHDGWLSIPLANQANHAVTENGNSRVSVVGTFVMEYVQAR